MNKLKKIVVGLFQTIAVLLLIFAIATTILYFNVVSGVREAVANETLPTLFGYTYFPVSEDTFESIGIKKGAIVLAEKDSGYQENAVVVFKTTDELAANAAYTMYGLGRVAEITMAADGSMIYGIESLDPTAIAPVPMTADTIACEAKWLIPNAGRLFNLAQTANGVVFFVIMPFFFFVATQLLVLILHIVWRHREDAEEDEELPDAVLEDAAEEEEPPKARKRGRKRRKSDEDAEEALPAMHTSLDALREETSKPHSHQVFTEDVANAPMNLKFEKKKFVEPPEMPAPVSEPAAPQVRADEVLKQPFASPDLPENLTALINRAKQDVRQTSASIEASPLYTGRTAEKAQTTSDYLDIMSRVNHLLDDINGGTGREEDQDFLKEAFERDVMRDSTVEFNFDKMNASSKSEPVEQENASRSQQILDNILIQLRENELDVDFNDVSEGVNVSRQPGGEGFTIDTPNYKAKIRVELDRK